MCERWRRLRHRLGWHCWAITSTNEHPAPRGAGVVVSLEAICSICSLEIRLVRRDAA